MDRLEYKAKIEEINKLIKKGNRQKALELLREENWKKVPNVNILQQAAELFEICDELDTARELLEIAHERSPLARMAIYRLAIISIKIGRLEDAAKYYDEFVQIAPHDSFKYIIRYEMNRAKGADDDTLISILEELKNHDFMEEWAYELARLYHKSGKTDKCIDLCDEIILWFGDGPYVERALELKMLYHPLDRIQEDKYRQIQQRKDGITEIRPGEESGANEILHEPIRIPEVEVSADKFNTVNLQAEIKKNIEEIMQATEAAEIDENMEAIKGLVEDIPYLQMKNEDDAVKQKESEAKEKADKKLDDTLRMNFQEYLTEAHDGQISMILPEGRGDVEKPIPGQMTIEDVMANWEKTRAAAEAALEDAKQMQFEQSKAKAIEEATYIMDRLEDVSNKLDAGVTPRELMKEEYLSKEPEKTEEPTAITENAEEPEELSEEKKALAENRTFTIPKIDPEGAVVAEAGLEIPIVSADEADVIPEVHTPVIEKAEEKQEHATWAPPSLEEPAEEAIDAEPTEEPAEPEEVPADVTEESASDAEEEADTVLAEEKEAAAQIVAGLNEILQGEIDRMTEEEKPSAEENELAETEILTTAEEPAIPEEETETESEAEDEEDESTSEEEDDIPADDTMILAESVAEMLEEEEKKADKASEDLPEISEVEKEEDDAIYNSRTIDLGKSIEDISLQKKKEQEAVELDRTQYELTDEEKETFSYFTPIAGMEKSLCRVLESSRKRLTESDHAKFGNILIAGGKGSGKTTLATNLIKVLQSEVGKPAGNVGKIDGKRLNEKDIKQLFAAVAGGCLIVEDAGDISNESAVTLALLMENDASGLLVIFEDTAENLRRLMNMNGELSKKFTEKINIPLLTIDELVNFGKAYANDLGYAIDEMGVLALYDQINLSFRPDHPTYLTEVKEIVDKAIDHAERGGLGGFFGRLGAKHYDDLGNLILQEKDFQE
ncbi:MAG: hypothetical protein K5853_09445 [Lachnospiraceae bacterium]|nr:hypothetical protein [Lachnospiraceae bacterium]